MSLKPHRRPLAAFALMALVAAPAPARAAAIEVTKAADGQSVITVSGEIARGDDERFATIAGATPDDATVYFSSPGGNLLAGLRIGSAIRMRAWGTAVADQGLCGSACGLAWLGGVRRSVGQRALVGFHAAYVEEAMESGARSDPETRSSARTSAGSA